MKIQTNNYRGYEILCRTSKTYIVPFCSSLHLTSLTLDYNYCYHFLYHRCLSGFLLGKSRGNPDTTIRANLAQPGKLFYGNFQKISPWNSSLFQALSQWWWPKKGAGDRKGLGEKRRPSSIILQIQQVAGPTHPPPTFSVFGTDQEPGTGYWKRLLKFKTEPTVFTFYT